MRLDQLVHRQEVFESGDDFIFFDGTHRHRFHTLPACDLIRLTLLIGNIYVEGV